MNYKAVFFDAGETLLSPHPSFAEIFCSVLAGNGLEVSLERVEEAFAGIAPTFAEVLDRLGTTAWSTSPEVSRKFWGGVYLEAFRRLGIQNPSESLADAMYQRFTRYESYRLFPDSIPVLLRIKEEGLTVGLISNFEEWLEGMLIEMEVAHLFDLMIISGKVGIEKPDPQIFTLALQRSGVRAAEAMYVGDHPRIDAEGAAAVGMTGVLIDRRERHTGYEGVRVTNLEQLLPILGIDHA